MDIKESIRIVDVDSYMTHPINGLDVMYSDFRGYSVNQVPVIRVFGSTSNGEKVCAHVHGVFPYLYIPYDGEGDVNNLVYQIAANIDKAINISLKQASSTTQHVYRICRVSAYPFYGYHSKQHQFLKIYLYNPGLIRRLSGLLQSEAILGKIYQPHEAHLPFILQFMIDYNLHGMSTMIVSNLKYRRKDGVLVDADDDSYLPPTVNKISCCEIECDIVADDIINRLEIANGNLAVNPGIAALWEDEKQRRRNKNEDSQIGSCLSMKNVDVKPTKSHMVYKRALLDRLAILSTDKELDKTCNLSVYPAETPQNESIQNASLVEIHSPLNTSSLSESFNSSLDTTISPSQEDVVLNNTMDHNFLQILEDLENPENSVEEDDCILTQVHKEQDDEDELDLSLPVEPFTPQKLVVNEDEDINSDEDFLDVTLIPQLDGAEDVKSAAENSTLGYNYKPIRPQKSRRKKVVTDLVDDTKIPSSSKPVPTNISLRGIKSSVKKVSARFSRSPIANCICNRRSQPNVSNTANLDEVKNRRVSESSLSEVTINPQTAVKRKRSKGRTRFLSPRKYDSRRKRTSSIDSNSLKNMCRENILTSKESYLSGVASSPKQSGTTAVPNLSEELDVYKFNDSPQLIFENPMKTPIDSEVFICAKTKRPSKSPKKIVNTTEAWNNSQLKLKPTESFIYSIKTPKKSVKEGERNFDNPFVDNIFKIAIVRKRVNKLISVNNVLVEPLQLRKETKSLNADKKEKCGKSSNSVTKNTYEPILLDDIPPQVQCKRKRGRPKITNIKNDDTECNKFAAITTNSNTVDSQVNTKSIDFASPKAKKNPNITENLDSVKHVDSTYVTKKQSKKKLSTSSKSKSRIRSRKVKPENIAMTSDLINNVSNIPESSTQTVTNSFDLPLSLNIPTEAPTNTTDNTLSVPNNKGKRKKSSKKTGTSRSNSTKPKLRDSLPFLGTPEICCRVVNNLDDTPNSLPLIEFPPEIFDSFMNDSTNATRTSRSRSLECTKRRKKASTKSHSLPSRLASNWDLKNLVVQLVNNEGASSPSKISTSIKVDENADKRTKKAKRGRKRKNRRKFDETTAIKRPKAVKRPILRTEATRRSLRLLEKLKRNNQHFKVESLNLSKEIQLPSMPPLDPEDLVQVPKTFSFYQSPKKISVKLQCKDILNKLKEENEIPNLSTNVPTSVPKKTRKKLKPRLPTIKELLAKEDIIARERRVQEALGNGLKPKFKIRYKKCPFSNPAPETKVNILSNIQIKASEPVNVQVSLPNNESYMYSYTDDIYPHVTNVKDPQVDQQNLLSLLDDMYTEFQQTQDIKDEDSNLLAFFDSFNVTKQEEKDTELLLKPRPNNLDLRIRFLLKQTEFYNKFVKQDMIDLDKTVLKCKSVEEQLKEFAEIEEQQIGYNDNQTALNLSSLNQGNEAEEPYYPNLESFIEHEWFEDVKYDKTFELLNLDGNCDSSSSDEDDPQPKKRRITKYSSLPISVVSSAQKGTTSSEKHHLSINKNSIINKTLSQKFTESTINVKRQLNFCDNQLDSTIVEEKLVCSLKTSHKLDNVVNGSIKEYNKDNSETDSNSSLDISPNNSVCTKLTKAQEYDLHSNFKAVEGNSKFITPPEVDSQSSLGSSLFSNNNENVEADNISTQSSTIFLSNEEKLDLVSSSGLLLKPVLKAPSRSEVIASLEIFNFQAVKHNEPFYSNVEDVTAGIEVGLSLLKVVSKTTVHLPEFETKLDAMNNIRKSYLKRISHTIKWNRTNINHHILSCVKNKDVLITPAKKPPSRIEVEQWLLEKSRRVTTPEKKAVEKVKIFIPLSPSENDEDMELSLTLSPCSPVSEKSSQSDQNSSTPKSSRSEKHISTPKSSQKKLETSPTLGNAKRKKKLFRSSQSRTISLRKTLLMSQENMNNSCQLTGVTVNNSYGFDKSVNNLQNARAVMEHQHLTIMVMELHIRTRGDLKPDPDYDIICSIFYSILNDIPNQDKKPLRSQGIVAINSLPLNTEVKSNLLDGIGNKCDITYVSSEMELLQELLKLIESWDPDILAGYEIEMLSWGYLIDRASVLGMNICPLLGRITNNNTKTYHEGPQGELKITGRIVLDVWRLMRHEIAIQNYSFESIMYHILQKRVPEYAFKDLTFWWDHKSQLYRHRTVSYYLCRVNNILELFDKLDLIGRTSELARLFGILFYEVLSRGSQFRVESMMLRLAKPLNFIPVTPSVQQRAHMNAPEYIPLVLEPESKMYVDPVVVLDFQSLYPSMIIAYNYCFSTCIGKVERLGKNSAFEFGTTQLKVSRKRIQKLLNADLINFSPCGVGFVKAKVREGILPRMLKEILGTRLMVKNSMKENKNNSVLQKVLHNRQLGLKLIANVTYGYTAANFSGRMPSVEVGDSVVSKGRETLQRAIAMVENTPEWGAKVVYGDTDSLFICFPGKSKEYAFEYGKKIADVITNDNPDPVKLKFEKVYHPCILQTKKRYVGYMYESPDQKEPIYEAKGIETVRRDGCPAVAKMLEKCLRLLFETKDVSIIKKYVIRQFNKIVAGRISIQDLTFSKEYRGASGYRPGACVPSLELAKKWKAVDKRSEPRSGERVPYIIVNGPPGLPIIKLVRSPRDLIDDPSLRPNTLYYITRVIIPPINRCLTLIGADLNTWFNQMPRKHIQYLPTSSPGKKSTISQYFSTTSCASCGEQTKTGLCAICCRSPQTTTLTLFEKIRKWEENHQEVNLICQSCIGRPCEVTCISLHCPVYYRRVQTSRDLQQAAFVRQLLISEF